MGTHTQLQEKSREPTDPEPDIDGEKKIGPGEGYFVRDMEHP